MNSTFSGAGEKHSYLLANLYRYLLTDGARSRNYCDPVHLKQGHQRERTDSETVSGP